MLHQAWDDRTPSYSANLQTPCWRTYFSPIPLYRFIMDPLNNRADCLGDLKRYHQFKRGTAKGPERLGLALMVSVQ